MRFASLFATLAVAVTSFVSAAPVANPDDPASAVNGIESQLYSLSVQFESLKQSSGVDYKSLNDVLTKTDLVLSAFEVDFSSVNGDADYNLSEVAVSVGDLIKNLRVITEIADSFAELVDHVTYVAIGRFIGHIYEAINYWRPFIDYKVQSELPDVDFITVIWKKYEGIDHI